MGRLDIVRNVANLSEIPSEVLACLGKHAVLLRRREFLEQLLEEAPLAQIAKELNSLCVADGVRGFHYSRNYVETIEREGLVVCTGDERRREFLARFGDRFTGTQRKRLIAGWKNHFDQHQNAARDGRIWFNLTTIALCSNGAERLLYHYGGEVIYMPFTRDNEIAEILHSIGTPMVVECALDTSRLYTFSEKPWGSVWLSTYHCSVNPKAHQYDVDVYTRESIPASNVLAVRSVDERL